jgi:hypothetical protein
VIGRMVKEKVWDAIHMRRGLMIDVPTLT